MGIDNGCYRYIQDLLCPESRFARPPTLACVRGPTPLNVDAISIYLSSHPDPQSAEYLCRGHEHGFCISFDHTSSILGVTCHNHPSFRVFTTVLIGRRRSRYIMQLGRHTELVKIDLSNAYRIVPVHPENQPLLGILWHGATYLLPFGLCSALKIFTVVADLLTWILYCKGIQFVLHTLMISFKWFPQLRWHC